MESNNMMPTFEDNRKTTRIVLLVVHILAFALGVVVLIAVASIGDSSSSGRTWLIVISVGFMLMLVFGFVALFYKNPTLLRIYAIVLCFFIAVVLINIFMSSSSMEVIMVLITIALAAVAAFFSYTLASHYEALQLAASLPPSSPPSNIVTGGKSPGPPTAAAGTTVEQHTSTNQQVQQTQASGAGQPHGSKISVTQAQSSTKVTSKTN